MHGSDSSRRKVVAYVEHIGTSSGYRYLKVKVPVAVANAVERDAAQRHQHGMRYYADAFADGLAGALTSTEVRTVS